MLIVFFFCHTRLKHMGFEISTWLSSGSFFIKMNQTLQLCTNSGENRVTLGGHVVVASIDTCAQDETPFVKPSRKRGFILESLQRTAVENPLTGVLVKENNKTFQHMALMRNNRSQNMSRPRTCTFFIRIIQLDFSARRLFSDISKDLRQETDASSATRH